MSSDTEVQHTYDKLQKENAALGALNYSPSRPELAPTGRQDDAGKLFDSYPGYQKPHAANRRLLQIPDPAYNSEDYRIAVESGSRHREAAFELALKSTTPFSVGDRVSYYITAGKGPSYDRASSA